MMFVIYQEVNNNNKSVLYAGLYGGLAIKATRLWLQWSLQSLIQNVKKGPFGGILGAFWIFYSSQRPFDPSPPLIV
jgi:hypothetical protein